ncbi:MAG: tetratricopeptide repeat protein, partial [Myxococcales bacterium]|nr:tetratricopeptide repeat protein [Myxococcales bacterium]
MMRSAILRLALGAALVGTALTGCGDNKNTIAKARRFAQQGNYAEAHKAFDEALAADANDYNALWGKADTYRREGNLAKQAEVLEKVVAQEELMKSYAGVIKPALEENYRKQAEQKMADAAAAEGFLRKAIELNKKSEANQTLANLLYKEAKEAHGKKDLAKALEYYGKALDLRMPRALRNKIKMQQEVAEFLKFKQDFEPTWQAAKPKLIEAGQYDEKTDTVFVTAEVEVDGKVGDEGYEQNAE